MDVSTPTVSPLRQRMVEDMRMRKFEPKTQAAYLRAVRKLTVFCWRRLESEPPCRRLSEPPRSGRSLAPARHHG